LENSLFSRTTIQIYIQRFTAWLINLWLFMNPEKLSQNLFNGFNRIYAVLDGASIPDLRMKLYQMQPEHVCLYRGELKPDMAEVAPYLVRINQGTEFGNWVLTEGWGNNWGIFVQSRYSLAEVRKHLRSFLTVHDETGKPMLFRFYDPRVLRNFLPTCNNDELKKFFGIILNFAVEDNNPQVLLNYYLPNGQLKINRTEFG
jgi:hypothetical protein